MIYLLLSISFSTLNHILFKLFAKFKIDLLSAIVTNYLICTLIGFSTGEEKVLSILSQKWYPFSLIQGALLVGSFFLIGITTKKHGVALTSLATRLSVALPTVVAFVLYGDSITTLKIVGLLLALFALYLSCTGSKSSKITISAEHSPKILPIILFISFGIHSILLKYVQENFLGDSSYTSYVMASFISAFFVSSAVLLFRVIKKIERVKVKSILSGIVLGCSNYGAVYFLIRVLGVEGWESSEVFPTVSVLVVILSAITAFAFFKEKISKQLVISLLIGLGSIVLINI